MSVGINLCNWVIKPLEANIVINFIHVLIVIEEILVPSPLEYAEVPGLCTLDVIRHEPSLDTLLQYQLCVAFQWRVLINMTPHILALWVIVRSLLPQRHPVYQCVMAFSLWLR